MALRHHERRVAARSAHTLEAVTRAFRTRLPPKVMLRGCKTAFRTRLPPKVKRKHPSGHSPAKQFRDSSPSKRPPLTRQSQCDSDIHLYTTTHNLTTPCACHESFRVHTSNAHEVLRLPRNVTSVIPRNLTIPCACHENRTSIPQNPHKVLCLPRKVTISSHVSFNKICTTPHAWNDSPKSPFQLRLVTKTELQCNTLKRKSKWHDHIQHPKNTTIQTLITMELRSELRISQNAAPAQRNHPPHFNLLHIHTIPRYFTRI